MNAANETTSEEKKIPKTKHPNKTKALQLLVNDSARRKKNLLMGPNCKRDEQARRARLRIVLGLKVGRFRGKMKEPVGDGGVFSGHFRSIAEKNKQVC